MRLFRHVRGKKETEKKRSVSYTSIACNTHFNMVKNTEKVKTNKNHFFGYNKWFEDFFYKTVWIITTRLDEGFQIKEMEGVERK